MTATPIENYQTKIYVFTTYYLDEKMFAGFIIVEDYLRFFLYL